MHPQVKIIGELPDGSLRAIAVNEDGSIPTTGYVAGAPGSGDASAANQEIEIARLVNINDSLGLTTENRSDPASGLANSTILGLLKSLATDIFNLANPFKSFYFREITAPTIANLSGTITIANLSNEMYPFSSDTHYLLIQNLVVPGAPNNNLWLNFNSPAQIGAGSVQIQAGETFEMTGKLVTSSLHLLGEEVGQQFTFLIGNFSSQQ